MDNLLNLAYSQEKEELKAFSPFPSVIADLYKKNTVNELQTLN